MDAEIQERFKFSRVSRCKNFTVSDVSSVKEKKKYINKKKLGAEVKEKSVSFDFEIVKYIEELTMCI